MADVRTLRARKAEAYQHLIAAALKEIELFEDWKKSRTPAALKAWEEQRVIVYTAIADHQEACSALTAAGLVFTDH
jgi:hypothetical protein